MCGPFLPAYLVSLKMSLHRQPCQQQFMGVTVPLYLPPEAARLHVTNVAVVQAPPLQQGPNPFYHMLVGRGRCLRRTAARGIGHCPAPVLIRVFFPFPAPQEVRHPSECRLKQEEAGGQEGKGGRMVSPRIISAGSYLFGESARVPAAARGERRFMKSWSTWPRSHPCPPGTHLSPLFRWRPGRGSPHIRRCLLTRPGSPPIPERGPTEGRTGILARRPSQRAGSR